MKEKKVERRATWDDTDCTTRIYFTAYMKWMDDALTEYFRSRGMTYNPAGDLLVDGVKEKEGTFVIGEYSCRIEKPSCFDDRIGIRVSVKEIRDKVAVFEGVFEDPESGQRLARGEVTFVWINAEGRSEKIPERINSSL